MGIARFADDSIVVWVRGEHDASTAKPLAETIARAIAVDHADVIIDMRGVEFMSCATVGVIVRTRTLLRHRSRRLTVRAPSRCARHLLELCDLTDLIDEGAQHVGRRSA